MLRMKKVVIIHGLSVHYHIICSFIEQFQDYTIDLLFPHEVNTDPCRIEKFDVWAQLCDQLNLKYNVIRKITPRQKYDYCVLDTDDDKVGNSYYNRYFKGTPVLVINHSRGLNRDSIHPDHTRQLWIWGAHNPSSDYYFFGFHYLNIETKMRLLTPKISVVIVGCPALDMENSPQSLVNHLVNFNDIDFYIINRKFPKTYNPNYQNIKYMILCDTPQMNYILAQSHYVWFYTSTRRECSSSIHMAYTMLCRCVLHSVSRNQYGIQTPIFGGDDDRFVLPPLTRQDVIAVSDERDYLFNRSKQAIYRRLIGDPVISDGVEPPSNSPLGGTFF